MMTPMSPPVSQKPFSMDPNAEFRPFLARVLRSLSRPGLLALLAAPALAALWAGCMGSKGGQTSAPTQAAAPGEVTLGPGWRMQDAAKVPETSGEAISQPGYTPKNWYPATVPGTVLTTLVNNKVYPEPLWGENNRPDRIPESLCRASYWYRLHSPSRPGTPAGGPG